MNKKSGTSNASATKLVKTIRRKTRQTYSSEEKRRHGSPFLGVMKSILTALSEGTGLKGTVLIVRKSYDFTLPTQKLFVLKKPKNKMARNFFPKQNRALHSQRHPLQLRKEVGYPLIRTLRVTRGSRLPRLGHRRLRQRSEWRPLQY